jgi:hypothetical protein
LSFLILRLASVDIAGKDNKAFSGPNERSKRERKVADNESLKGSGWEVINGESSGLGA